MDYRVALRCAYLCQQVYSADKNPFVDFPDAVVALIQSDDAGFTDTQAALIPDAINNQLYVVFRGSDKSIDWINNFQLRQQIYPYGDGNSDVRFHRGFMAAYFAVRDEILAACEAIDVNHIVFAGHSLGGALATIAALDVQYNIISQRDSSLEVYTYGSPRVGNGALVESYNRRVPNSYRFVYGWDVVTRVPRLWQGYEHVDQEFRLGSRWTWQVLSRRFQDHQIRRYVDALAARAG